MIQAVEAINTVPVTEALGPFFTLCIDGLCICPAGSVGSAAKPGSFDNFTVFVVLGSREGNEEREECELFEHRL